MSRVGHLIQPISPKSPAASVSAFESVEASDGEDNMTDNAKLDSTYLHPDGNVNIPDHSNATGEPVTVTAPNMIRSPSVSGDLDGVQPNPVAGDILSKEPEQEIFVQMRISPSEIPSLDEVEVYRTLQGCLELRKRYVFREAVTPWEKEIISDPCTPKPIQNPFDHIPGGNSDHYFQMEGGVVHVYRNKASQEKLFPVADATMFFTDLHYILKAIAAGNIRTLCHHRLVLLEQVASSS